MEDQGDQESPQETTLEKGLKIFLESWAAQAEERIGRSTASVLLNRDDAIAGSESERERGSTRGPISSVICRGFGRTPALIDGKEEEE